MGFIIGSIFSIILHIFLAIFKFLLGIVKRILIVTRLIVPAVLGGGFFLLFYLGIIEKTPLNIALAWAVSGVITLYVYYRLIRKTINKNKKSDIQKKK